MNISIQYNRKEIVLNVPKNKVLAVVEPNDVEIPDAPEELLSRVLAGTSGTSFKEFLEAPGKLLVIVNDGTRPTPTCTILDSIADQLAAGEAEFLVATGAHRKPTREEFRFIFGEHYERFARQIFVHDARNADELVRIGTSSLGTEMIINRRVLAAEKILVIGSVEPHYFAGYTGGRKGILPGVAGFKTIEQNHAHALDPRAKSLALEGNPVHDDMIDALDLLKNRIFGIMAVLDKNHEIYCITAGDINSSFTQAVQKAEEVFVAPVSGPSDVVVSVSRYPMDIDLYQAQKSIENGKLILKEGGILILVSACWDGVGDEVFFNLLSLSAVPEEVFNNIKGKYELGYHKAGRLAEVFLKAKVWAKTELPDDVLEKIFMRPVNDLQKALDEALEMKGSDAKVIFLADGSVIVPRVNQEIT